MKRISDRSKKELQDFLKKCEQLKNCTCDSNNPCRKCIKIVTGKEYLRLVKNEGP